METDTNSLTWPTDERRLLSLAAHPATAVFPIFRYAAAMTPLVVLLALLPPLWAVQTAGISDPAALWGMRALEVSSAQSVEGLLDPGRGRRDVPFRFQPPLMTWLTAATLAGARTVGEDGLWVAAWICTAGLIGAVFLLARRFGGPELALVVTVLSASHPQILSLAQAPFPHALSLCLMLLAATALLAHLELGASAVTKWMLGAGMALAGGLLAGGPVAAVVWCLLSLYLLILLTPWGRSRAHDVGLDFERALGNAWRPILLLGATAFAFGGWWELMMASDYGLEFWSDWLAVLPIGPWGAIESEPRVTPIGPLASSMCTLMPFLLGFLLLGIWRMLREVASGATAAARQHGLFIFLWAACGLVLWKMAANHPSTGVGTRLLWQNFVLLPFTLCAALGVLDIAERRVGLGVALAAFLVTGASVLWYFREVWSRSHNPYFDLGLLFAFVLLTSAALWHLHQQLRGNDARQRWLLGGGIALILSANFVHGMTAVSNADSDDRELTVFRDDLMRFGTVSRVTVVSSEEPPLALRYVIR
ncbi:MAG TPA: hypothetical protein VHB77_17985, partial [Planctomycetaceae bacterium]|nr:hypothetical protein [Planctomycetaceae bacterium]